MTTNPAEVLGLPKPAWAGDDVGMLYDMATQFLGPRDRAALRPNSRRQEMVDRVGWEKAGADGPALRLDAGRIWRLRRHLRA